MLVISENFVYVLTEYIICNTCFKMVQYTLKILQYFRAFAAFWDIDKYSKQRPGTRFQCLIVDCTDVCTHRKP